MLLAFREEGPFGRVRDSLFGDDEGFRAFQNVLMSHPRAGDVIPGTGGARKVRWNDPNRGKGKRSGIRVIYAYIEEADFILLLYAYNKNTSDVTPEQKRLFREKIEDFRKEVTP